MAGDMSSNDELSPVKRALIQLKEMRARVDAAERALHEPIAIVGLGCRFPGGAAGPDALWRLLADGVDAITEVPPDRWDVGRYFNPDPDVPGTMCTRFGGFLDAVDRFDAAFFGINPREAAAVDPQQRLLLEVAWEALEHAGIPPDRLFGTPAGVFVALTATDYLQLELRETPTERIDPYFATGGSPSVASGRLSYALGLQGPSLTVETACSSSLVTVHLAMQSLRAGECDVAMAGGTNTILLPELTINFSRARMMAPDGRCKTFDAAADGYVRSEGCGMVVLKRLSDARAAGDRVLAVLRGSAVNQDGRSSGLTAPSGTAQRRVLADALVRSGVAAAAVDYVEAHGTGTALGDPIELRALGAVLTHDRPAGAAPLLVGSIKTNLGHLEAAAGVAGLIKVVLALEHDEIPPHLHFTRPTPLVDWDDLRLAVPTARTPWPRSDRPRTAGVSSFGFSGTNAHVVVQDAPLADVTPAPAAADRAAHVLTLSARSAEALRRMAVDLAAHLRAHPDESFADVCHTRNAGRSHFGWRLALVVAAATEAADGLERWLSGVPVPEIMTAGPADPPRPRVHVVFAAGGELTAETGRQLYAAEPEFRAALDRSGGASTSPAALEQGLLELWRGWGVEPAAIDRGRPAADQDALVLEFGRAGNGGVTAAVVVGGTAVTPRDGAGEVRQMLRALAALYVHGVNVDWNGVDRPFVRRLVSLPTYPFEPTRFWYERAPGRSADDLWTAAAQAARDQSLQGPLDLRLDTYAAKWAVLEDVAAGYIAAALGRLGVFASPGEACTLDEVLSRGVAAVHRPLVERWLGHLTARGFLEPRGSAYVARAAMPRDVPADLLATARRVFADSPAALDLVERCGPALPAVVAGDTSPLDLLFPDGSSELAERLYESSAAARYVNAMARAAVHAAAAGRPVRILEIGAGTGGTTAAIVRGLDPVRTGYTFTDVSPLFLDRAQEKFAGLDFMEYGLLDAGRAPASQGFVLHAFDVVVASNVLHATRNLDETLGHVRDLLGPGGLLVLIETTVYHAWLDVTFGLTNAWNQFDDRWRRDRPLLAPAGWREALLANGFEAVEIQPDEGTPGTVLGQCVVVALGPTGVQPGAAVGAAARRPARAEPVGATAAGPGPVLEDWRAVPPAERHERLVEFVAGTVARVLRLDPAHAPARTARLMDSGLDSLMAVELRNALAQGLRTPRRFPATLMFDYPTIEAIAGYIDRTCLAEPLDAEAPGGGRPAALADREHAAARLEPLDERDIEALLNERLERL
jgi:3-oxoacyl-(acyl-carrier-protein) synthase/SAM-dependent methyltransferase